MTASPSNTEQSVSLETRAESEDVQKKAPDNTTEIKKEIRQMSQKNGIDEHLALSIARCESYYRQFDRSGQVLRGQENAQDVGIFQINEKYHLARSQKLGFDIYSTEGNIGYALHLLKTQGDKPWIWSKNCWTA